MRRPVRMGRPGLIGTASRTAVIAGSATALSGNVARRQHERAAQEQQAQAYQAQQTTAEFEAQKARVLGI